MELKFKLNDLKTNFTNVFCYKTILILFLISYFHKALRSKLNTNTLSNISFAPLSTLWAEQTRIEAITYTHPDVKNKVKMRSVRSVWEAVWNPSSSGICLHVGEWGLSDDFWCCCLWVATKFHTCATFQVRISSELWLKSFFYGVESYLRQIILYHWITFE